MYVCVFPAVCVQDPIKLHEQRALNFLAHEYFMQQGDKLTAITLTEENSDQDFDDWDDVGLNIPKPPDLLFLFRSYSTFTLSDREKLERIKNLVYSVLCAVMYFNCCVVHIMYHYQLSCVCLCECLLLLCALVH